MCFHFQLRAQICFDIKDIDGIVLEEDGSLSFYQKKGKRYRLIEIDFDDLSDKKTPNSKKGKWFNYSDFFDDTDRMIPVSDIKSFSSKGLKKYLTNTQFKATKLKDGDLFTISQQLFNPYLLLITDKTIWMDSFAEEKEENIDIDYYLRSFCILRLGFQKYIIMHYGMYEGYYIPTKGKDYIFVSNFDFHEQEVTKEPADDSRKNDDEKIGEIESLVNTHYYINDYEDKEQTLIGNFDQKLLPGTYDHIDLKPYFIAVTSKDETKVYNLFLELVADNVRSCTFFENENRLMHILKGNQVNLIDYKGKLNQNNYLPKLSFENRRLESPRKPQRELRRMDGSYHLISKFSYSKNPNYNFTQKNKIILPENSAIEDVHFLYSLSIDTQWFYAKRNGKAGLYSFKFPKEQFDYETIKENNKKAKNLYSDSIYTGNSITPVERIPQIMDSITVFRYDNQLSQFMIYKDGLIGLYPFQSKPKYKVLNPKSLGGFLRYEMPNGKKGWLNLQTFKEYMDF